MEPFEKLIKGHYVPNVQVEILTYLFMVNYKMDANLEKLTSQHGITRAQFSLLNILSQRYPRTASVGFLQEHTLVVKSDVSRIVRRLEKAGLIDCIANQNDKRALDITINERGRDLFDEIAKRKEELLKPFESFSEEEIKELKRMLRKWLEELEKESLQINVN